MVLLATTVAMGCGSQSSSDGAKRSSPKAAAGTQPAFGEIEIQTSAFASLEQMVARSDLVAMVEIVAVKDGKVIGEDHSSRTTQVIAEVKADTPFKGAASGQVFNVWIGMREASVATGEEGLSYTSSGYQPAAGDKLLVGLVLDQRYPNTYGLESNDSFFVVGEGGAAFRSDIQTSNAAAKQVRSKPVSEAVALLRQ